LRASKGEQELGAGCTGAGLDLDNVEIMPKPKDQKPAELPEIGENPLVETIILDSIIATQLPEESEESESLDRESQLSTLKARIEKGEYNPSSGEISEAIIRRARSHRAI
jgi:hypothetical protein